MGAIACVAGAWTACQPRVALPPNLFPETAAGGWRRVSVRELPVSESPDPVPRTSVERLVTASYDGPGKLDARVYALSSAGDASGLIDRWRPSSDTIFFGRGRLFVVIKWQSADRKLLQEFVSELEKRLAAADDGRK
jgi:hypothetical protein